MRKLFILFLISFSVLLLNEAKGQNTPDVNNLQNLNVDDLSDDQVKAFIKKAEESGYSEQQMILLAKARGMSATQISKLQQRIREVQSKSGASGTSGNSVSRIRESEKITEDKETPFDPFTDFYEEEEVDEEEQLPVFGMSFFKNQNLTFEPSLNIPTPKNYVLGSGDQIIIDIWGASENTYQLSISPEGSIIIPNIGPIYLSGLTVEKAEGKVKSKLKSIYSTLDKNTYAQMSLGQIRTISVNVIGEVVKPGTYSLSSFATAFNALYMAGGPSKNGSLRDILVFRSGKKIATLDAYKFLVYGEGEAISLQDQDVILIKPYTSRVSLEGEVKRKAHYEIKEDETLADAIDFAGGFTGVAYTKTISLQRNAQNFKTVKTVAADEFDKLTLEDGDKIQVGKISNLFQNRVRVEGAVNHSGEFEFSEGMMLSSLVSKADGFRADAFMTQALIIRENSDLTLSNLAFEPTKIVSGEIDIELQSGDLIKVQSIFDLHEAYSVSLQGEVLKPGDFPFIAEMTVENLIFMSGGFKETAAKSFVEVARRITDDSKDQSFSSEIFNFPISEDLKLSNEASTFKLAPFDLIVIRKSPFYESQKMIEIQGEAQFPGKYAIESKNERISDLVKRSGGLTQFAYPKGATLIRRTEYFANDDESSIAANIRREELQSLFERDTLTESGDQVFRTQESIGIELEEIMKNPGSSYDLILKEGDVLSIPRELQTIHVRGQVLYPSTVRFDDNSSFKQFIGQAGGFSDRALKRKSYVVYANGTAQKTNSFLWFKNYPKIEPGAELIIPEKKDRRQMSPQEVIAITTGLATLGLLTNQIINTVQ